MSNKLTGNIVNIPVKKPSMEELERSREQISKLMDRMKTDPALLKRYADLTTERFQELLSAVQRIGLDTAVTFKQVWDETAEGNECPFTTEQIGHAAMTTLNIVAVAYALGVMAQEADRTTFTQEEVNKLWADFEIDPERGN